MAGTPRDAEISVTFLLLPIPMPSAEPPASPRTVAQQQVWPPEVSDTALLMTSEAVTNALVHGRSAARLGVSFPRPGADPGR